MSDWSATMSGAKSINAGLDMTMPGDITMGSGDSWFGKNLTKYLQKGEVSQKRLDDMAVRILAPHYLLGQDKVRNFDENSIKFDKSRDRVELIYLYFMVEPQVKFRRQRRMYKSSCGTAATKKRIH